MPTPITINEMAAAVTSCDGHGFVLTTQHYPSGKRIEAMTLYTLSARASTSKPRDPYPLIWEPRYYGAALALAGLGGA